MPEALALPSNLDVERFVLGAVLTDEVLFSEARAAVGVDDFSLEKHRRIWRRATECYDAGQRVDRVVLASALHDAGELESVDGLSYLVSLDDGLPRVPSLDSYVRILKDDAARRRIIVAADALIRRAANRESPQSLADSFSSVACDVAPAAPGKGLRSARDLVNDLGLNEILAPRVTKGLPFPWQWMTGATCGMLPGELWVLAAHTSAGKTSAAIQTAVHAARQASKAVAMFSLEMGSVSIFQRAVWQLSRVDSESAKRNRLSSDERRRATDAVKVLYDLPLHFDDASYSVMEIHARLRRLRASGPIGLVVADYLQLLRDGGRHGSRAEAVGANARAMKLLAGEFECPVLLLSQFSRESAKTRGTDTPRRPELHDLKESGDVENHASGAWFIHRTSMQDADRIPVEFILAKQRDGRRNIFREFWFTPAQQRFDEREGCD